ncbi:MAG: vitamin K epoxide reductase family protein [Pseudomonadota bacterium]
MAKAKKKKKNRKVECEPAPAQAEISRDWPLVATAGLGVVLTTILVGSAMSASKLPYCGVESACDIVQSSAWSNFLGLPLALWGLGAYGLLLAIALSEKDPRKRWRRTTTLSTIGFIVSVYLTAVSYLLIDALCAYCLGSALLMTIAFALSWRSSSGGNVMQTRFTSTAFALLIAVAMHANATNWFAAPAVVDPYVEALVAHLNDTGAKFYGASWCPNCRQQKAMFGPLADKLPYVECSPAGPKGPRATECEIEKIAAYPTWIIDGRRVERPLTVDKLALYSRFRARETKASK